MTNRILSASVLLTLSLMSFSTQAALPLSMNGEELPSLAPMIALAQPGVVNVSTTSRVVAEENPLYNDPFFRRFFEPPPQQRERRSQSLGSGVIVDAKNGYIITNHHVIDKAEEISVTLRNGKALEAELIGSDEDSDIAVIKVEQNSLTEIPMGSSENLRVGDFVVAIGSPFGLSHTVTSGIVSALGRSGLGIEGYEDFIQTDASINPGNSGGALVNLRGELIGINTAILSRSGGSVGIGFAIPIDMVKSLMTQMVEHGDIKRGLLGVTIQDLTPNLAEAFDLVGKKGAVVSSIIPDSAAEAAGIKDGDVIYRVDDTIIESSADLRNAIGLLRAGDKTRVYYYRDGSEDSIEATIQGQESIAASGGAIMRRLQGARFRTAEPTREHRGGIEVVEVTSGSAAWEAGLREGDIILSANRQRVFNLKQLKEVTEEADDFLLFNLLRGDGALFLIIQ